MRRIIPLILLLSLMLTGCGSAGSFDASVTATAENNNDTSTSSSEADATSGIDLSGYTVVRAANVPALTRAIVAKLYADISALGGSELGIGEDFLKNTDPSSDEVSSRPEILVGRTNRPESSLDAELGVNDVLIKQVGRKIVVLAGCELSLADACELFVKRLHVKDGKTYLDLPDGGVFEVLNAGEYVNSYIVTDQKNSKISFYSINRADLSTATLKMSFSLEQYNAAGLKLRRYGEREVLLAAYGSNHAKMIDIKTKDVLWSTATAGANPHSVELTPNGVIAVASSTGAVVNFYSATDASKMLSVPFPDAHGALYDPDTDLVYVVGENRLRAFFVGLDASGNPTATENKGAAFTLPTGGAHDLQPVYGDTDRFWITTVSAVYQYSVSEKRIVDDYGGKFAVNTKNVKGIGNFDDGGIMYVSPDGKFKDWTSESVYYIHKFDGKYYKYTIKDANTGIYKLRVYNLNYQ